MHKWSFSLLDSNDQSLGVLDGVTGGSCELVAQSALGGSGSLNLDHRDDIDWMSHRVQATFHAGDVSWPVGVFLLSSPTEKHTMFGLTYEVGLLTKMNVINEDTLAERFSLPAGAPIIPAVVNLIQSTGELRVSATSSDVTVVSAVTWDAGTSKLRVINELLTAAGYWSLWCDGSGLFRVEPYTNPADRPVMFSFEHGAKSLHMPDWGREQNHTQVPNRIILRTEGDDDTPPLYGVATNEDPASPYSYQGRGGRWISPEAEVVEAASQEIIDALAARRLRDAMSPVSRLTVTHAMLPLEPNGLVEFTPEDGVRRLATVQRMSMRFDWDTDVAAEWREVPVA